MTLLEEEPAYWQTWLQRWFYPLLAAGILINASGLLLTILEPDGALYATIAKTMAQSGDFINLKVEGKDWLDKPHFPFWIAALSYRIFGVNSFAYKFPALLFWGMGAWYTGRLAHAYYGKAVAQLSVLIYLTAAHLVISNNDVRAEPYLTGLIAGSVYYYSQALRKTFSWQLVIGSLLAACAVMTKGPFVLITIGAGFIIHWIIKKDWKQFVHPRWWLALTLVAFFILPELYCLYVQFDAAPQKIVFGRTGVSGLRFFFWDSQFGRFFNTGPIRGQGDPFFYFHTLLWAFLPWSLLLYAAMGWKIKAAGRELRATSLVHGKELAARSPQLTALQQQPEYIMLGAVLVSFLVFSLSRFQLPHYMNILFPFFSILLAHWLSAVKQPATLRAIRRVQYPVLILLVLLVIAVALFFKPPHLFLLFVFAVVLAVVVFGWFVPLRTNAAGLPKSSQEPVNEHRPTGNVFLSGVFGSSFVAAIFLYGFMNCFFYPTLLRYQSGSEAAFYINGLPPGKPVGLLENNSYSFAFYLKAPVHYWRRADVKNSSAPVLVFTQRIQLDSLAAEGVAVETLRHFPHFHISQLTGSFINYRTRDSVTEDWVVAAIRP